MPAGVRGICAWVPTYNERALVFKTASRAAQFERKKAMNEITINPGSDLTLTGTWRDAAGQPVDLTGWTIAVFEPHPLAAGMTVEWTNAATGQYRAQLAWNDAMPTGKIANFRLRITSGTEDRSSPQIFIGVQ